MRRELAIALGAPLTWWIAALAAFVAGHSFVLALDLYSAASRSVDVGLGTRGLEPLLGIVRPTLGGAAFCLTVLGPVLAARGLAIDRERRTLHSVLLVDGSVGRVLIAKWLATAVSLAIVVGPAVVWCFVWVALGGHLGAAETMLAIAGLAVQVAVLAAWGVAAAAWTRGLAAAIAVAMVLSLGSWVLDGTAEIAALSWLTPLQRWSLTPHLDGMQRGVVIWGDLVWLLGLAGVALLVAWVGLRGDRSPRWRVVVVGVTTVVGVPLLGLLDGLDGGRDLSDSRRGSLPETTVAALREIDEPMAIDVWLDRDDARRAFIEGDALLRMRLSLPGLEVRFPLDRGEEAAAAIRDDEYGLVVARVGATALSTRGTGRRELTTLLLEAAGKPVPKWSDEVYPGHPLVIAPHQRRVVMVGAYLLLPLLLAATGLRQRIRSGGTPR